MLIGHRCGGSAAHTVRLHKPHSPLQIRRMIWTILSVSQIHTSQMRRQISQKHSLSTSSTHQCFSNNNVKGCKGYHVSWTVRLSTCQRRAHQDEDEERRNGQSHGPEVFCSLARAPYPLQLVLSQCMSAPSATWVGNLPDHRIATSTTDNPLHA